MQGAAMNDMKRRDFLRGVGLGTMGIASLGMLVGCSPETKAQAESTPAADDSSQPSKVAVDLKRNITPDDLALLGGSTMSLLELNQRRHELVDSKGDFTGEDGTVIPAVWNKLRALIDSYGWGCGSAKVGTPDFAFFQMMFSEEEAQAYLEMPYGIVFTAADFAEESGREEAECAKLCEDLAARGLLWRAYRSGVPRYHQLAVAHGIFEYNLDKYWDEGWLDKFVTVFDWGENESGSQGMNAGTSFYYAIPCDKSVVADEKILVLDDYEKIVARNSVIGVSPCQCRLSALIASGEDVPKLFTEELKDYMKPDCGHPLETCLTFGEEAEYYIEKGIARQIDQDECLAILKRSVEHGMVLQSCFTKDTEVICSCHGDCCGILSAYVAVGPEGCATSTSMPNMSHYTLQYDKDACIKCGACVKQCPMFAIELDKEGYPVVNPMCVRCGQCGTVCPAGARTLTAKPEDQRLELPSTLLEDYNLQASYRFDQDLIY